MIELRGFCDSLCPKSFPQVHKLLLTTEEWEMLENITQILEPFAVQTKLLQKEQLSLSDFFGGWATIKMSMNKTPDDLLARNLLAQMRIREKDLFDNRVLNAAVFLDPRFQQYMPNINKDSAIEFLSRLHVKLISLEKKSQNEEGTQTNDELESFLSSMMYENDIRETNNNNNNQPTAEPVIADILKKFIGVKESLNISVFDYWQKNKHIHPTLYKLASVVHSVPPTQTTVERAFSAMALIMGPLRTRISDDNLSDSLLIRLNQEIFEQTQ